MWITFVDRRLFTLREFGGKQLYTDKNQEKIRDIRQVKRKKGKVINKLSTKCG